MDRLRLAMDIFTPRQAIRTPEHLAGRAVQQNKLIAAHLQAGAHAVVYGERGVGKTSLANCVAKALRTEEPGGPLVLDVVNCDGSDDYSSLWHKVFQPLTTSLEQRDMGLRGNRSEMVLPFAAALPDTLTPFDVQGALVQLAAQREVVVLLDEFDRLQQDETIRLLTDTLKGLSDQAVPATVVVVGVGESIRELIRGHESISRHLVEVPVPRLNDEERRKVILDRLPKLGLSISDAVLQLICSLSRGLPYYVHLLGQKTAMVALQEGAESLVERHVASGVQLAVDESERALRDSYYDATRSTQSSNLYPQTIAACALAECDEFGYFTLKSVKPVLSRILGVSRTAASFKNRLEKMTGPEKGSLLIAVGEKYDRRFRSRDPLAQPFVVMKSLATGIIGMDQLVSGEI